jgi:hypothetical protein
MSIRLYVIGCVAALVLAAVPAWAHHAFAAEFDSSKPLTLKGNVTKWELINPHSWIHLDVVGDDGKVIAWAVETAPPNNLYRLGFTRESLPPGTEIVIEAFQAKDGSNKASGKDIRFPDGRKLLLGLSATAPVDSEQK